MEPWTGLWRFTGGIRVAHSDNEVYYKLCHVNITVNNVDGEITG